MRFAVSLRNCSLGLATASFLFTGVAWASPAASTLSTTQQNVRPWNLVGVDAQLDQALDASSAHRGQAIEARLAREAKTADGVDLPRGTQLVGEIDRVQASTNGGPSIVSLVFTEAELKDGRTIPVKVTVIGAYPADEAQLAVNGAQTMPPAPKHISYKERVDQEPGMLSHVSMHSAVQNSNSAIFRDNRGNLKLRAGTFLQVGIAPKTGAASRG
jgi:hypothetical protein